MTSLTTESLPWSWEEMDSISSRKHVQAATAHHSLYDCPSACQLNLLYSSPCHLSSHCGPSSFRSSRAFFTISPLISLRIVYCIFQCATGIILPRAMPVAREVALVPWPYPYFQAAIENSARLPCCFSTIALPLVC